MAVTVTPTAPPTAIGITGGWVPARYGIVAGSVAEDLSEAFANKRVKLTSLVLSGTYATNGFALTPSAYGLKEIHAILVLAAPNTGAAATPLLTTTGGSPVVKLATATAGTELANTTSVANFTFTCLLVGI